METAMKTEPVSRMPALFLGHGSPMNALERNVDSLAWRAVAADLPRPRAILTISAHWLTRGISVTAMSRPRTIHDFTGFPRALNEFRYPAAGEPALARRVADLLAPEAVTLDAARGLDHGAWSVLAHLYPAADVPVVQLSLDAAQAPAWHYQLAARLRPLRDEGVLILGSGNVVHNLRRMDWGRPDGAFDWAQRFNDATRQRLLGGDHAALFDIFDEDARLAVPTPEHYWPLLYVAAQQAPAEAMQVFNDRIEYGCIGMLSCLVGSTRGDPPEAAG